MEKKISKWISGKTFFAALAFLAISTGVQAQLSWTGTQTYTSGATISQSITLTGNTTVDVAAGITVTISGVISGNYTFSKSGDGTLILRGNNTYSGLTTVSAGVLQIASGSSNTEYINNILGGTSGINLSTANAMLRLNAATGNQTFSKAVSGLGKVEINCSYSSGFNITGNNTYTGTTTANTALNIGYYSASGSIAGDIICNSNVTFSRSDNYTYSGHISGNCRVTKVESSTLTFTNANTYTGATIITEGTLYLDAVGSIENSLGVEFQSYTDGKTQQLIFNGNKKINGLTSSGWYTSQGIVSLGYNTLTIGTSGQTDGGGTFDGTFTGTGSVIKQGTGVLTISNIANTATGGFWVNQGRVNLSGNWAGSFIKGANASLGVVGNPTISGNLTLSGGDIFMNLMATPSSKLSVGGAVTATGTNTIHITINASVTNYVLMGAASGITSTAPYALDIAGNGSTLSVVSPTTLLLNAVIVPVCEITNGGVTTQYAKIDDAIDAIPGATQTTIKLLADITHDGGCQVSYKYITFDLNGKNLTFTRTGTSNYAAFEAISGSKIDYQNAGTFKVISTNSDALKVVNSDVTLTYAETSAIDGKSAIYGEYSPYGSSTVIVNGDVKAAGNTGVNRNHGVYVQKYLDVTINGNINVASGIGANAIGVLAEGGSTVTANGTITAPIYIQVGTTTKTAAQYAASTTKAGYLTYTDNTNTVWVKYQSVTNITGVPTTATIGTPLTLTGTVEPAIANAKTIVWTVSSAGTTGAQIISGQLFASAAGTVIIMATIHDGKFIGEDYTQGFYITVGTTGIDDVETQALKIYPNPVKDELIIESGELKINKVEICDLTGKTIYQFDNSKNKIDVSALSQGIYIVKIETDKGNVTRKFVKE